ncbi:MAG: cytochrome c-type biogenesis protein CcmH [Gemmatimonadota bacterium]
MRAFLLAVLVLVLSGPAFLAGQIPEGMEGEAFRPHPEATEAISRLYSPFCPGFMLEVCTAAQSVALRDSIQALAYQGWTSEELVEWMLANHGERYRAVPQGSGWGLWAWLLPPIGLVVGAVVVVTALRRFGPPRRDGGPASSSGHAARISQDEEERLRSAIREIELNEDPSF